MSKFMDLAIAARRHKIDGLFQDNLSFDVPSFDFGHMFDLEHEDSKIVRGHKKPFIYDFFEGVGNFIPAGRAYVYHVSGKSTCIALVVKDLHLPKNPAPDQQFDNTAVLIFTHVPLISPRWFARPVMIANDWHDVVIAEWLLQNRSVEYSDAAMTGTQRMKMRESRTKVSHTPKVIRLHQEISLPSAHRENGRHIAHAYEVGAFKRRYKRPIKHGPNAGRTEIVISGHQRGIGLPSKPRTAEYMQHRVVA